MITSMLSLLMTLTFAQDNPPGQVRMKIPLGGGPGAKAAQPATPPVADPKAHPFQTGQDVPAAPVSQIFASDAGDSLLTEELIRTLRDPFSPPVSMTRKGPTKSELETIELRDVRLNGVITGPKKVRAMVSGPGNKTFFVAVGDKVGTRDGRITAIQSDLIKVVEYDIDQSGRRIPEIFEVRITGEVVSLSKKED